MCPASVPLMWCGCQLPLLSANNRQRLDSTKAWNQRVFCVFLQDFVHHSSLQAVHWHLSVPTRMISGDEDPAPHTVAHATSATTSLPMGRGQDRPRTRTHAPASEKIRQQMPLRLRNDVLGLPRQLPRARQKRRVPVSRRVPIQPPDQDRRPIPRPTKT